MGWRREVQTRLGGNSRREMLQALFLSAMHVAPAAERDVGEECDRILARDYM